MHEFCDGGKFKHDEWTWVPSFMQGISIAFPFCLKSYQQILWKDIIILFNVTPSTGYSLSLWDIRSQWQTSTLNLSIEIQRCWQFQDGNVIINTGIIVLLMIIEGLHICNLSISIVLIGGASNNEIVRPPWFELE